jgi:hypothetical protein
VDSSWITKDQAAGVLAAFFAPDLSVPPDPVFAPSPDPVFSPVLTASSALVLGDPLVEPAAAGSLSFVRLSVR